MLNKPGIKAKARSSAEWVGTEQIKCQVLIWKRRIIAGIEPGSFWAWAGHANHNATATVSRHNQTQTPFKARKGLLLLSSDSIASINNWQLHRKERSYFILWGSSQFLKHHLISSFIKPWDPQKFPSLLSFSFPFNVLLAMEHLNVVQKETGLSSLVCTLVQVHTTSILVLGPIVRLPHLIQLVCGIKLLSYKSLLSSALSI